MDGPPVLYKKDNFYTEEHLGWKLAHELPGMVLWKY